MKTKTFAVALASIAVAFWAEICSAAYPGNQDFRNLPVTFAAKTPRNARFTGQSAIFSPLNDLGSGYKTREAAVFGRALKQARHRDKSAAGGVAAMFLFQ